MLFTLEEIKMNQIKRKGKPYVLGSVVFMVVIAIGAMIYNIAARERPRVIYSHTQMLSEATSARAKVKVQTAYEVSEFSNESETIKMALIPLRANFREVTPLTPCTEEQSNLKIDDTVVFEHSETSLDPNEPYSLNLLCYMAIKK